MSVEGTCVPGLPPQKPAATHSLRTFPPQLSLAKACANGHQLGLEARVSSEIVSQLFQASRAVGKQQAFSVQRGLNDTMRWVLYATAARLRPGHSRPPGQRDPLSRGALCHSRPPNHPIHVCLCVFSRTCGVCIT